MSKEIYVLMKGWEGEGISWPIAAFSSLYDLLEHMKDHEVVSRFNDTTVTAWKVSTFIYSWESVDYYG